MSGPVGALSGSAGRPYVAGISSEMRAVQRLIAEIAPTEIPVLIVGESGTGKEITAQQIHTLSKHSALPFVKVSCAKFSVEAVAGRSNGSQKNIHWPSNAGAGGTVLLDDLAELDATRQREMKTAYLENNLSASGLSQAPPKTWSRRYRPADSEVSCSIGLTGCACGYRRSGTERTTFRYSWSIFFSNMPRILAGRKQS